MGQPRKPQKIYNGKSETLTTWTDQELIDEYHALQLLINVSVNDFAVETYTTERDDVGDEIYNRGLTV